MIHHARSDSFYQQVIFGVTPIILFEYISRQALLTQLSLKSHSSDGLYQQALLIQLSLKVSQFPQQLQLRFCLKVTLQ